MSTLVLAEHDNARLNPATLRAISAASALGAPIHILVAGEGCDAVAAEAASISGVEKVLVANGAALAHGLAEPLGELIVSVAEPYRHIAAAATSFGKNVLPRVAALLGVMQVSDISAVVSDTIFERPIYAGGAIQKVEATGEKIVLTVRAPAFEMAATGEATAPIETVAFTPSSPARTRFVGKERAAGKGPDLASARIVVSGGRALGSAENFEALLTPLAETLGAAIGASRAAVDAGYAPNDWQVGQTGKVVQPDLYIAIGISGAIQHLAGMKNARVIVAIDKDPDAAIFGVADYGLVADIFEAVPELTKALS
ncbi:electron transfer flavoprotein subunit alpha/FixB family protein [Pelagibacterium montanilacus]|uniref:electron transfer flavoprotein subunit alpha/FixB family protein n=1 Tax=Pelagibacterium montanilacus TaxID=2185280 RepID=UPI000F8D7BA4|nr:FAD-binding protein [Pelagibacterium montanilacus]